MATTCEDLFVACNNSVVDNRRRRQNKAVRNNGDYVEVLMVDCDGLYQDDSGADLKLKGEGPGSVKMQKIIGGRNNTIVQHDTKKEVENRGASGKEAVIHDLENAELKLDSKNVEERVSVESGDAYALKAKNSVITGKDKNVKRVVIRKAGNDGGPNTKTVIPSASDNAELNTDSANAEDCIRGKFDKGSKVHAIEATKGARVKRKATNSQVKIKQASKSSKQAKQE